METNKNHSTKRADATTKSETAKKGLESKTIRSTANAKHVGGNDRTNDRERGTNDKKGQA